MADKLLVPSIEQRLASLIEITRRNAFGHREPDKGKAPPAITISREFGCEGFPVAEKLKALLEKKTGDAWEVMDKELMKEVARHHNLGEDIFKRLGEKNLFLDEFLSTFSPRWHSDKDYYKLLTRQIVALATGGNVIIVGRGSTIVTQKMSNCFHFRIIAPLDFRTRTIAKRLHLSHGEAEDLVLKRQKARETFIHDFLDHDIADPNLYHLILNNGKAGADRIAETICGFVTAAL